MSNLSLIAAQAENLFLFGGFRGFIGDMLLDKEADKQTIEDIINKGVDGNESMKTLNENVVSIGGGAYKVVCTFAIIAGLIMLVINGVKIIMSNSSNREQHKSDIVWCIIGIILVFAAGSIMVIGSNVGNGLFSSAG